MKKFTLNLFAFILSICATQTLAAQNSDGKGEVIFKQMFDYDMGEFVVEGPNGTPDDPLWFPNPAFKCMVADGYGKGGPLEKIVSYCVSPSITLGTGNELELTQDNFYFTSDDFKVLCIRETGSEEWTVINAYLPSDMGGLSPVDGIKVPEEFDNKSVQFAFRYTTPGSESSGIWQIGSFTVITGVTEDPEPEPESIEGLIFQEKFEESMNGFVVEGFNGQDDNTIWNYRDEMRCVVADGFGKITAGVSTNYFVSPEIQLLTSNKVNFMQMHFYFTDVTNETGLCIRKAGTTEWTPLNIVFPEVSDLAFVGEQDIPAEFDNQKVQFGFKYTADGSDKSGMLYMTNFIVRSDDASGIEEIIADKEGDNKIYDLNGRRVINPKKGLYIMNGKKYVVK